jgi:hypothetical protein
MTKRPASTQDPIEDEAPTKKSKQYSKLLISACKETVVELSLQRLPSEILIEIASWIFDVSGHYAGYFATFPLLYTSKFISNVIKELPIWKFVRALKQVTIEEQGWKIAQCCSDFQWGTHIVYGKVFLRMLNHVLTHIQQRNIQENWCELTQLFPCLKELSECILFDYYLLITDEESGPFVFSRFTLKFKNKEFITILFNIGCQGYWKMWIDDKSTSISYMDLHPLDLVACKLNITDQELLDIFHKLFDLDLNWEMNETDYDVQRWIMAADLIHDQYYLSEKEVPHEAEKLLTVLLDYHMMQLVDINNERHADSVKNIIDVILRNSYLCGAKVYTQLFILDKQLAMLLPDNFVEKIVWKSNRWFHNGRHDVTIATFSINKSKSNLGVNFKVIVSNDKCNVIANFHEGDEVSIPMEQTDGRREGYKDDINKLKELTGCNKLSNWMFIALLNAISNIEPHEDLFIQIHERWYPFELILNGEPNEEDGLWSEENSYSTASKDSNEHDNVCNERGSL